MTRLTLLASADALTGYGQHAIEIIRHFERLGVFVSLRPLRVVDGTMGADLPDDIRSRIVRCPQPEEWELLVGPPHHFPTPGKKTVAVTMWESTTLPDRAVDFMNRCAAVVVPCNWCADSFADSGVTVPVHTIPLGVSKAFEPMSFLQPFDKIIFSTAGRTAHGRERKGMDAVIRCFLEAFPSDERVELRVKCHEDCQLPTITDPRIIVCRKHLTQPQLCEWLNQSHCFVSAARGEGWGLWQNQAMACGIPVIAAPYAGLADFMDFRNSFPVSYYEVPARGEWAGKWAYPNEDEIVAQMRAVYDDASKAKAVGRIARETVQPLTWQRHCQALVNVLVALGALPCSLLQSVGPLEITLDDGSFKKEIPALAETPVFDMTQVPRPDGPKIIFSYSEYEANDADEKRRMDHAKFTWRYHFDQGTMIDRPLFDDLLPRSSAEIDDPRPVPYLRDIIASGMNIAMPGDIVVYCNRDIGLTSVAVEEIKKAVAKNGGCCYCLRHDLVPKPGQIFKGKLNTNADGGMDLFAMTPEWWVKNGNKLPDFVIGRQWWDTAINMMMDLSAGGVEKSANCPGIVYHEPHKGFWRDCMLINPGQRLNRALMRGMFKLWGKMDWVAGLDAEDEQAEKLLEIEAEKKRQRMDILIITYARDAAWLGVCLKSIGKYCTGFGGVTVVFPRKDADVIYPVIEQSKAGIEIRPVEYDVAPAPLEFLHHMVQKCCADILCPDAALICHVDSDCVFYQTTTPQDYLRDGKPVMLVDPYEVIKKTDLPRYSWKAVVERALKQMAEYETMCRHPAVHWRELYSQMRLHVESVHGKGFTEYVLEQNPSWQWGFSEFNTLGAYALATMCEKYAVVDVSKVPFPEDRLIQFWSHGPMEHAQESPLRLPAQFEIVDGKVVPLDIISKIL